MLSYMNYWWIGFREDCKGTFIQFGILVSLSLFINKNSMEIPIQMIHVEGITYRPKMDFFALKYYKQHPKYLPLNEYVYCIFLLYKKKLFTHLRSFEIMMFLFLDVIDASDKKTCLIEIIFWTRSLLTYCPLNMAM